MTVIGARSARATTTAVLPTPVGPRTTGVRGLVSGTAKPAFQFLFRELHHRGAAVDVMRGQSCGEQAHDQPAHLARIERLPGLDRRAARVSRGETLEPILPTTTPSAGQVGDALLEAATGLAAS